MHNSLCHPGIINMSTILFDKEFAYLSCRGKENDKACRIVASVNLNSIVPSFRPIIFERDPSLKGLLIDSLFDTSHIYSFEFLFTFLFKNQRNKKFPIETSLKLLRVSLVLYLFKG